MRGYNYKTGKIPHCTRSSGMNFIQNLFPPGRKILQPTWPDTLVSNPTPIQSIFFPSRGDIFFVITSPYHDNIKTLSKDGKVVSVSAVSVIVTSVFIIAQRCVSCTRIRQQTMQVFGWLVGWLVGLCYWSLSHFIIHRNVIHSTLNRGVMSFWNIGINL